MPVPSLFERLTSALDEAGDAVVDIADLDGLIDLDEGESITWLAQTYHHGEMINLLCLTQDDRDTYLAVCTGDGGRLAGWMGPDGTLDQLKARVGDVPEGWSEV